VPHPLAVIDTGPEIGWLQFHGKGLYVYTDIWRGHPSMGIIPKQRQAYIYRMSEEQTISCSCDKCKARENKVAVGPQTKEAKTSSEVWGWHLKLHLNNEKGLNKRPVGQWQTAAKWPAKWKGRKRTKVEW